MKKPVFTIGNTYLEPEAVFKRHSISTEDHGNLIEVNGHRQLRDYILELLAKYPPEFNTDSISAEAEDRLERGARKALAFGILYSSGTPEAQFKAAVAWVNLETNDPPWNIR